VFSEVSAVLDKNWKEVHHNTLCEILANVERECSVEICFVKGAYQFRGTLSAITKVLEKLSREPDCSHDVFRESSGADAASRDQQRGELSGDEDTVQVDETDRHTLATAADHVISDQSASALYSASDAPLSDGCDSLHPRTDEHGQNGSGKPRLDQSEDTTTAPSLLLQPSAIENSVPPKTDRQASDKNAGTDDGTTNASEKPDSQRSQQIDTTDDPEPTETENQEQGEEKASQPNIHHLLGTSASTYTDKSAIPSNCCTMTTSAVTPFSKDNSSGRRNEPSKIRKDLIYTRESEKT